jgi:hypothetical protein
MAHIEATPRVKATTINREIRKTVQAVARKRRLLAGLQSKGRVQTGFSGDKFNWRTEIRNITVNTNDDMKPLVVTRTNLWKKLTLPKRSLRAGEAVSKDERLSNKGPEQIINIVGDLTKALTRSITEQLADDLYNDGNSSTNNADEHIHGFESWCGSTGTEIYDNSIGIGVADPDDSYAEIETDLDYYGAGSWTAPSDGEWPMGTGDPQYCALSPLLIDYGNTYWAGTANTWYYNWRKCMRFGRTYMESLHNEKVDVYLLNAELYRQALDSLTSEETIEVRSSKGGTMTALGFEAVTFEGTELTFEYGVPANVGYGFIWDKLQLISWQNQLFQKEDDYAFDVQADELSIDFWGQFMIDSPAFFVKFLTGISETH